MKKSPKTVFNLSIPADAREYLRRFNTPEGHPSGIKLPSGIKINFRDMTDSEAIQAATYLRDRVLSSNAAKAKQKTKKSWN